MKSKISTCRWVHIYTAILLTVCACTSGVEEGSENVADQAQSIVDHAIAAIGGDKLDDVLITFAFRDRSYQYQRDGGAYEYQRLFIDAQKDTLLDILTNDGLIRLVNGTETELEDKKRQAYSNSVNSVIYFALLPYGLNDPAVIKSYEDTVSLRDKQYHQVRVAFQEEGGGVDHEDNFLYWFDVEDYSMDFMAYDYVTDESGVRLREAFNPRVIEGVTFQDYKNYKPTSEGTVLDDMLQSLADGGLTLLSTIELKNIQFHHSKTTE